MPLKVTFELSDRDLRYFRKMMDEVAGRASETSEDQIIEQSAGLLSELPDEAPGFIRERAERLERMVGMLTDEEWKLEGKDRTRVVKALSYFAEPQDLIPDTVPGLGYLDDAIMVELVVRELQHEIDAYEDFCRFRSHKEKILAKAGKDATSREEWLKARRNQLQTRMRRRRRRTRGSRAPVSKRSPLALW